MYEAGCIDRPGHRRNPSHARVHDHVCDRGRARDCAHAHGCGRDYVHAHECGRGRVHIYARTHVHGRAHGYARIHVHYCAHGSVHDFPLSPYPAVQSSFFLFRILNPSQDTDSDIVYNNYDSYLSYSTPHFLFI